MVFKGILHRNCLLGDSHKENGFQRVATLKVVFKGLAHGNNFKELAIPKMFFMDFPHRQLIRGACHTENGSEGLPTQKIVQRGLSHGEWF